MDLQLLEHLLDPKLLLDLEHLLYLQILFDLLDLLGLLDHLMSL